MFGTLLLACLASTTLVDFAKTEPSLFTMTSAAFVDSREPKQFERGRDGLVVRLDEAREKPDTPWATMSLPKSLSSVDYADRSFVLVLSGGIWGRITRNIAVNVTDARGETFQFSPIKVDVDDTTGEERYYYRAETKPGTRGWGGKVNDGVLDRPGFLSAVNFHYRCGGRGGCTLKAVEEVVEERDVPRDVLSVEPISTDVQSPGAEPFHGAKELLFTVRPACTGKVRLTLSTESKGMAHQGRMVTYDADSVDGRVVFRTDRPWSEEYEFIGLRTLGERPEKLDVVSASGRFLQTEAEAMRLDVDTKNELHLCRDEGERPELLVGNPTDRTLAWKTTFVLSDVFGRKVNVPFDRSVASGETVRLAVPWPLPAKGAWTVSARLRDVGGRIVRKETRFAYVDRHEVTPLVAKPKFRFGIHYHGTKYWPDKVDKTIGALVAAGAKFTRCDYSHMWSDIEPRPGEFHWERSDAMIEKLRAAGLALDIIMYGLPAFARDPAAWEKAEAAVRRGIRVRGSCVKTKPGLFRAFCETYGRRYGTKIDYYEVGNEWDLSSAELFPHEAALAIQREAYEGLHAGCPDVCVTPNGWAAVCSPAKADPVRWNAGIQEAFAEHPELYDCWALHVHGSFASYVDRIDGSWKALRERTPLKSRPWVANETANTCAFGNERTVSRQVWEKPLFAWSRGSRDYIWYNLRATGWFDGGEPGYGLITAGFYPRATYAAFAALTAVFQNLDYDGSLYSHRLRHLLRFRGRSQVLAEGGLVLAGWDDLSDEGVVRNVRIRTDAKRAELSDYMGNRKPLDVVNGEVVFPMSFNPQALLLPGATVAEAADPKELSRVLTGPKTVDLSKPDRRPDFVLSGKAHYHSYFEANPPYAHRLWTGEKDLSAKVWLSRRDGALVVRAEVVDDKLAIGDRAEVTVESAAGRRTVVLKPVSSQGEARVCEASLPLDGNAFGIDLRIHDDDGEGPDGYLMLCREGEDPVPVELVP